MAIRLITFLTVFLLLACTVTAIPAAMYREPEQRGDGRSGQGAYTESAPQPAAEPEKTATEDQPEALTLPQVREHVYDDTSYTPRLTAPEKDNSCYYSDRNIFYAADYGMPNCTCYAWGRAYEINGEPPELSPYDACTWYAYNAENGIYDYGSDPEQGAIACWAYADGGPGHVAVVEEVEDDMVLLSNSAYSGTEFYMDTVPADDPSEGREGWIFQGYIYVNEKGRHKNCRP